jgi:GNAT superfamily N-acetyltransferase
MNRKLSASELDREPEACVRPTSPEDVAAVHALAPDQPSNVRAIKDPKLHDFVAEVEGKIAAKAQVVTTCGAIAYVSNMFTTSSQRLNGLGSALLQRLHREALATGAQEIILVPSRMARRLAFYEKHGCSELIPMHLLIPSAVL